MAVVTKYGRAMPDPATYKQPRPIFREANVKALSSDVAIANGDSATSIINFGRVGSNVLFLPQSLLFTTGIAGLTSFSLGFAQGVPANANGGALASALMLNQDLSAAGSKNAIGAVPSASLWQRAWQLAGYAVDPGLELDLIGTMNQGAGAAGTLALSLLFAQIGP